MRSFSIILQTNRDKHVPVVALSFASYTLHCDIFDLTQTPDPSVYSMATSCPFAAAAAAAVLLLGGNAA